MKRWRTDEYIHMYGHLAFLGVKALLVASLHVYRQEKHPAHGLGGGFEQHAHMTLRACESIFMRIYPPASN
jgi:hypothetical protein